MSSGLLTIDLGAVCANWRALDTVTRAETSAVVKADAYGLGMARVARALATAGARTFFVANAEEGAALRQALGPGPAINILSGHMPGDTDMIGDLELVPMLNSVDQMIRHVESLPGHSFGIQLDTGMNRLGMEPSEWSAVREIMLQMNPRLIMSHLACADEPDHPMNQHQLSVFKEMTDGLNTQKSLANTGGILLGREFDFELTRPGIGLYGGHPFDEAQSVVSLDIPVIQCRDLEPGESVGYGNSFIAERPTRIATIAAGYADGILRAISSGATLFANEIGCPLAGRVSMDMIGVDVTKLDEDPKSLRLLGAEQSVDDLADCAETIGYEILTSLGSRYTRRYIGI
ncbi:Alanine racemase, biosynthetic [Roseovarius albus]|uniref:Alanine racemase n=1 Tax=Roseovarius albus TaxID=1247867 RepID=A0A1X6ZCR8_9RHOB|nr:alanine racemase [Roseovarius albus]SLN47572.1 Alanine racemase, biosynthetic [Roseovarius albus]